jgi:hypothetical protein
MLVFSSGLTLANSASNSLLNAQGQMNLNAASALSQQVLAACQQTFQGQQAQRCRHACGMIYKTSANLNATINRPNVNRQTVVASARTYLQSVKSCAQGWGPRGPAALGEFVKLAQQLNQGKLPQPSARQQVARNPQLPYFGTQRPQPARSPSNRSANVPTVATDQYLAELKKASSQVGNLARFCSSDRHFGRGCQTNCNRVKELTGKLIAAAQVNEAEKTIKTLATGLKNSARGCSIPQRSAALNVITQVAEGIEKNPGFHNLQLAKQHQVPYEENLELAPLGYVAKNVDLTMLANIADSYTYRCQGNAQQRSQCKSQCKKLANQAKSFNKTLNNLSGVNFDAVERQADGLVAAIIDCNDFHYKNKGSRSDKSLVNQLRDGIKEEIWPKRYAHYSRNNRPASTVDAYVFKRPKDPDHLAFAKSHSMDSIAPVKRYTKRTFDYGEVANAYQHVAENFCNGDSACEFRCKYNPEIRDNLISAFSKDANRHTAAKSIRGWQCGGTIKGMANYESDSKAMLIVEFQDNLDHQLWPQDVSPYTDEIRKYCEPSAKGKNPFYGFPACEYASAIYYGDFETAIAIDHRSAQPMADLFNKMAQATYRFSNGQVNPVAHLINGDMSSLGESRVSRLMRDNWSLVSMMFEFYLLSYQTSYPQCISPQASTYTLTRQKTTYYKNRYGFVIDRKQHDPVSYHYKVNPKFLPVARTLSFDAEKMFIATTADLVSRSQQLNRYDAYYSGEGTENASHSIDAAVKFMSKVTDSFECNSGVTRKLEDRMLEYFHFKGKYAKRIQAI